MCCNVVSQLRNLRQINSHIHGRNKKRIIKFPRLYLECVTANDKFSANIGSAQKEPPSVSEINSGVLRQAIAQATERASLDDEVVPLLEVLDFNMAQRLPSKPAIMV